ncbi:MAG: hypothetical protein MZV70_16655, partial [Desulfobacterales bacterium]|nr:hypothetical protein [Desulfobacterales bacterium]
MSQIVRSSVVIVGGGREGGFRRLRDTQECGAHRVRDRSQLGRTGYREGKGEAGVKTSNHLEEIRKMHSDALIIEATGRIETIGEIEAVRPRDLDSREPSGVPSSLPPPNQYPWGIAGKSAGFRGSSEENLRRIHEIEERINIANDNSSSVGYQCRQQRGEKSSNKPFVVIANFVGVECRQGTGSQPQDRIDARYAQWRCRQDRFEVLKKVVGVFVLTLAIHRTKY